MPSNSHDTEGSPPPPPEDKEQGVEFEVHEGEPIEATAITTLAAVDRAAIDVQVATAKRYPRTTSKSLDEALSLATLDEETAASCFYVLPRAGKQIEGPSARLAEIMAYTWGNLRVDADIVGEDKTHVTAMGTCFDLEKNVAVRVRVRRRITDRHGNRYNEDMIGVTSNAAISIALRNAIFKVVPAALTQRIYQAARKASIGEAGTMVQTRQNAIAWFAKAGIVKEKLFELLGVQGLDDIGQDELITLRGFMTALKDGETTVEYILRSLDQEGADRAQIAEQTRQQMADLKQGIADEKARKATAAAEKDKPKLRTPTGKFTCPGCKQEYGEKHAVMLGDVAYCATCAPKAVKAK